MKIILPVTREWSPLRTTDKNLMNFFPYLSHELSFSIISHFKKRKKKKLILNNSFWLDINDENESSIWEEKYQI